MAVRFDVSRVFASVVGEGGIDEARLEALRDRAREAARAVQAGRGKGPLAFMELPYETSALDESRAVWKRLGKGVEDLVVLGIGGSALGTTCLATALLHPLHNVLPSSKRKKRPRLWVLDNIDPDWFEAHMSFLDPRKTLFDVVTKSGTTAETMAQFMIVRKLLERKLGKAFRKRLVCTTDPASGELRKIATDEGFETLSVPSGVGGRWSVLSAVGLFPAVALGMDVEGLLAGAREMDERCRSDSLRENPALLQAAILFLAAEKGIRTHVMMPYCQALKDFADWYRQLLAESLGKRVSRKGAIVHAGLTPEKALGVTDQHSQIQLYTEGPFDKLITIVAVEEFSSRAPIPKVYADSPAVGYLCGKSLAELIAAERAGTEVALEEAHRPYEVLRLQRLDAHALGELIAFAELSIAYAGELFDVNAFDQPGVEAGKNAAYALMGRKGYEELARRLAARRPPEAAHVL